MNEETIFDDPVELHNREEWENAMRNAGATTTPQKPRPLSKTIPLVTAYGTRNSVFFTILKP
jgi:hypothetical protein